MKSYFRPLGIRAPQKFWETNITASHPGIYRTIVNYITSVLFHCFLTVSSGKQCGWLIPALSREMDTHLPASCGSQQNYRWCQRGPSNTEAKKPGKGAWSHPGCCCSTYLWQWPPLHCCPGHGHILVQWQTTFTGAGLPAKGTCMSLLDGLIQEHKPSILSVIADT